jgi:hypothetical protein
MITERVSEQVFFGTSRMCEVPLAVAFSAMTNRNNEPRRLRPKSVLMA